MAYAKMIRALAEGDASVAEISAYCGLHAQTVREHVAALRKEKEAHRSAWGPDSLGRLSVELFSLGKGKDAPRRPLTDAQRSRDYRASVAALNSLLLQLGHQKEV